MMKQQEPAGLMVSVTTKTFQSLMMSATAGTFRFDGVSNGTNPLD